MRIDDDGEGIGPEERSQEGVADIEPDLARSLLRVAAIPANEDVLDAALRLVVALARVTVTGADGVSVCLSRHGTLSTVAASDATVTGMDRDQYATGEGPCVAAATEGHWFHVESLDDELRWPAFIPRARDRGINSILSTPLLAQTHPVGAAQHLLAPSPGVRRARARALVDARHAGVRSPGQRGHGRLDGGPPPPAPGGAQGPGRHRQARGALMERHSVAADVAYTMLRRSSRQSRTPLRRVAEDVMDSAQSATGVAASDDA